MKRKIKNQMLPVLKMAVGNYYTLKHETIKRFSDPDNDDYSIDIYQLDSKGNPENTFHPIEDICAVARAFNVLLYVTKNNNEDYVKVHLF